MGKNDLYGKMLKKGNDWGKGTRINDDAQNVNNNC
jgi:hypothetical protein